jgi:hypothetical protein
MNTDFCLIRGLRARVPAFEFMSEPVLARTRGYRGDGPE